MADFEDFGATAASIALQIERKLIALGVDWHDESALKQLAADAMQYDSSKTFPGLENGGETQLARMELCGLIGLMNATIAEGANDDQRIHGSDAWKALAKALWSEKGNAK
ncbi:MAG TPA: hypothetical protein VLC92_07680 [Rhodocyclaceae bacterium]|nr:hypothetical protein [Rhodocyclaceae bacterium]